MLWLLANSSWTPESVTKMVVDILAVIASFVALMKSSTAQVTAAANTVQIKTNADTQQQVNLSHAERIQEVALATPTTQPSPTARLLDATPLSKIIPTIAQSAQNDDPLLPPKPTFGDPVMKKFADGSTGVVFPVVLPVVESVETSKGP